MIEEIDITNDEALLTIALAAGGYPKNAIKHVISAKIMNYMLLGKKVQHFVVQFDKTIQVERTIVRH